MPWLLYRYILLDLLRLIGLTTAVLVTVIAFGATLKPLARGGVDAIQIAKYLGLVIVPMLQFALPFAAGFGATMSLYRLTTDNEIQAMAASGISYRRILLPIAGMGIALTLLMIVLTQTIIPKFWTLGFQVVTADVVKWFQSSIERGEAFQIGKMQIYADRLIIEHPTYEGAPDTRMHLLRMAAADLDDEGRIVTDITARIAAVDVYRRADNTYLKMTMEDAVALNAQTGHLVYSQRIAPPNAITVPNVLNESTKALSRTQLLQLRDDPDDFAPVRRAREALAQAIEQMEVRETIVQQLHEDGGGALALMADNPGLTEPRTYQVQADHMLSNGSLMPARGSLIEIIQFDGPTPALRFRTGSARLVPSAGASLGAATFDLVLGDHEVLDLTEPDGPANRRANLVIPSVRVAGQESRRDLANLSSAQLLQHAAESGPTRLTTAAERLVGEIESLQHEITGRLSSRYAVSITACLLLLLGATMSMWRRNSLPLTTYFWAFLPAVLDLIVISAGEQLVRDGRAWGQFMLWSGNGLLLIMFIGALWRLSRN